MATLTTALSGKQDAVTAATDAELASAVATLNTTLAGKQDASTAATDLELAGAVATINTALAGKVTAPTMTASHGLTWNGSLWVDTDLTTQAELEVEKARILSLESRIGLIPSSTDPFRFDSTRLAAYKAAIAARQTTPVNILEIGDSITEGSNETALGARWVDVLRTKLRTAYQPAGVTGGIGFVPADYQSATLADPVSFGGAASDRPAGSYVGLGAVRYKRMPTGATATFTFTGTGLDIICTGVTSNGTYTRTIDGGSAVAASSNIGATKNSGAIEPVRGLSASSHTVVVSVTSGYLYHEGFFVYNGDEAKGIRMVESGASGARATDFVEPGLNTAGNAYWYGEYQPYPASLVSIAFGTNDYASPTRSRQSPRAFRAALEDLIEGVRAQSPLDPSIVLWEPAKPVGSSYVGVGTFVGRWSDYIQAIRQVAARDGRIAIFDAAAVMGDQAVNANGYTNADGLHPSTAGHAALGQGMFDLLQAA